MTQHDYGVLCLATSSRVIQGIVYPLLDLLMTQILLYWAQALQNNYNMSLIDQFLQQHKPISVSPSLRFDLTNLPQAVSSMIDNLAQLRTNIPDQQKKIVRQKQEDFNQQADTLRHFYEDINQSHLQLDFNELLKLIDPNQQSQWYTLFLVKRKQMITERVCRLFTEALAQCGERPKLHQNSFKIATDSVISSIQKNGKIPKQAVAEMDLYGQQLFNSSYFNDLKRIFVMKLESFLNQLKLSQMQMNSKFEAQIQIKPKTMNTQVSKRSIEQDMKQSRYQEELQPMIPTQEKISASRAQTLKNFTPMKLIADRTPNMDYGRDYYYNQAVKTSNRWLSKYR